MIYTIQLRDYFGAMEARREAEIVRARRREAIWWRVYWIGTLGTLAAGVIWGAVR